MWWLWRNQRSHDGQVRIEGRPAALADAGLRFDHGAPTSAPVPPLRLVRDDDDGELTDNLIAPGTTGLVWSSRLRAVLAAVGVTNLEVHPLVLVDARGGERHDYALVNLLGRPPCIDLERSALHWDPEPAPHAPPTIEFIDALVLRDDLGPLRLMRAAEHAQVIVAHDDVRAACVGRGISGVVFERPEDFSL